jgi:sodium-dependent dicarboxylate transporter 2/3/5
MWISNTATAIMMLAIGLAIISEQERMLGRAETQRLNIALLLGIAYGASIGGVATLVGTPPNLSFVRIFEITFPAAEPVAFGTWMLFALPLSLILLVVVWWLLTGVFFRTPKTLRLADDVMRREAQALGPMCFAEGVVLAVFAATALLWVFRKDLTLGALVVPGWSRALPEPVPGMLDDGTVAIAMALVLFLIPSRAREADAPRQVLDISVFVRIPWHIVLLFGGGFALASGFQETGLSSYLGAQFAGLEGTPPMLMIASVAGMLTFLTELTSNTATTELMLPILGSVATTVKVNPLLLMIPATVSASFAFMMPVATPPNAIIFGSGRIRIADMAKVGIFINLIGILVVTLLFSTLGRAVFDIQPGALPEWAQVDAGQAGHEP